MIQKWWDNPQTEKVEKWTAYLVVPILVMITTAALLVAFDTRSTVIRQHTERVEQAQERNQQLVEDLREIQNELQRGPGAPNRTEAFNSIEDIERKIDRLLRQHSTQGSLDRGS